jgi:DNA-binding LacI/PurR family transcriptional regulator
VERPAVRAKNRATLRDVARIAGVSHNTVSLVVRNSGRVLPETRARVQAVIDHLGYQPNAAAAALRSARSGTIGYLFHRDEHDERASEVDVFGNRVSRAVMDTAEERERFVLQAGFADAQRRRGLLSSGRVDGLLVDMLIGDDEVAELSERSPVPIVVIGRACGVAGTGWVRADEEGGAYAAARHLLESGRDEIGLLTVRADAHPIVRDREAGVRRALDEAGIRTSERRWFGDWSFESGYAIGAELAGRRERPSALFALNELMAVGCLQALLHAGVRVPRDVAVVAVEDSSLVEYVRPQVSAVHVPMYAVARRATELVLDAVESGGEPATDSFATELVVRASSCTADRR